MHAYIRQARPVMCNFAESTPSHPLFRGATRSPPPQALCQLSSRTLLYFYAQVRRLLNAIKANSIANRKPEKHEINNLRRAAHALAEIAKQGACCLRAAGQCVCGRHWETMH